MAYALAADMVARFGELEVIQITDRNQDGQIDEDVARGALEDASVAEHEGVRAGLAHAQLSLCLVADERYLDAEKSVEHPVAHASGAGPLGVLPCLGPESELGGGSEESFSCRGRKASQIAVFPLVPGGPSARRLIDHVDDVAFAHEIFAPSGASIRRSHPVGGGLRRAVYQHDRMGVCDLGREQGLDVHLAFQDFLTRVAGVVSADVEIASLKGAARVICC